MDEDTHVSIETSLQIDLTHNSWMTDSNLITANNRLPIAAPHINARMTNLNKLSVLLMVDGERCDGMGYANFLEGTGALTWTGDSGVGGVSITACFESVSTEG